MAVGSLGAGTQPTGRVFAGSFWGHRDITEEMSEEVANAADVLGKK